MASNVATIHQTIRYYSRADRKCRKYVIDYVWISNSGSLRKTGFSECNVCEARDLYMLVHRDDMLQWPCFLSVLFCDGNTPDLPLKKRRLGQELGCDSQELKRRRFQFSEIVHRVPTFQMTLLSPSSRQSKKRYCTR